jgi:hypothetical protein
LRRPNTQTTVRVLQRFALARVSNVARLRLSS